MAGLTQLLKSYSSSLVLLVFTFVSIVPACRQTGFNDLCLTTKEHKVFFKQPRFILIINYIGKL